jgi:hypothetical protein
MQMLSTTGNKQIESRMFVPVIRSNKIRLYRWKGNFTKALVCFNFLILDGYVHHYCSILVFSYGICSSVHCSCVRWFCSCASVLPTVMFSICYAIYINCIVTQHDSSNINSLQSVGEVLSNFSIDGILFLLFAEKSPSLPSRSIHAPFHVCLHRVTSPLHRPSTAPLAWLH